MSSRTLAFVTGIAMAIPVVATKQLGVDGFPSRFLLTLVWLLYLVAVFVFVLGPQRWETFRWVPEHGTVAVLARGIGWLLGGLLSVASLEAMDAI